MLRVFKHGLDFLGLKDTYAEKDLEAAILRAAAIYEASESWRDRWPDL